MTKKDSAPVAGNPKPEEAWVRIDLANFVTGYSWKVSGDASNLDMMRAAKSLAIFLITNHADGAPAGVISALQHASGWIDVAMSTAVDAAIAEVAATTKH